MKYILFSFLIFPWTLSSCQKFGGDELITITYRIPLVHVTRIDKSEIKLSRKEILIAGGVTFPPGSSLFSGFGVSAFAMKNTKRNHEKLQEILTQEFGTEWHILDEADYQ